MRCTRRRRWTGRHGGRSCATSCCRTCKGPLALAFLLATLNHINNFTLPFVLFGAPAPESVNVMPMIVYVTSFTSLRFGLSAAMAIVSLIIIAIPLFVYLRAVRLDVHEEGAK